MSSRGRRLPLATVLVVVLLALMGGSFLAAKEILMRAGRTPAEILDYADRRMQGHPKAETLAAPLMATLRAALDVEPLKQRLARGFEIPPPPPRRGPEEILPPEPAPAGTTIWRVGPGQALVTVAEAARRAKDGDIVEIEAGDYFGEVASWPQRRLTIRGVNGAARMFAAGRNAEGKAIWVFKRGTFDVSNIDFVGARAGDGNGAGIRLERGHLRVRHCLFWDNQMGLLTAGLPHAADTQLEIESSEFAYSHVDGRWGHNLYVGRIDRLRVTGSYFHHASRGHLLKSRAAVNEIDYSRFTDESGGRASYELDFPNGGEVRLVGNIVQQQPLTENGIMVSYGEEGHLWPRNTLELASNTLVNDLRIGGAFVRATTGLQRFVARNNLLVGQGRYLLPELPSGLDSRLNDQRAGWPDLVQASRQDYRLREPGDRFAYRPAPSGTPDDEALVPRAYYAHPRRIVTLPSPPRLVGATQGTPP